MTDKVATLDDLGSLVSDGDSVALGGGWFANHPMAAVRQLLRNGARDLRVITVVGSIDIDLLVGAGAVSHLEFSMVTLEAFGLAPNVRRAIEGGLIGFTEYTGLGLLIAFEAQGRGVPYMPYRGPFGSDIPAHYPEIYQSVQCPFTGRRAHRSARPPARRRNRPCPSVRCRGQRPVGRNLRARHRDGQGRSPPHRHV